MQLERRALSRYFVSGEGGDSFRERALRSNCIEISEDLYETLRVEVGIPKFGIDMDETTIVPELGLDGLISYSKGCYIGQEIIARIHFRGHVAKKLTGLTLSAPLSVADEFTESTRGVELTTPDGKNAGRITSCTFSPKLGKYIALAYVRYDYLTEGTELLADRVPAVVTNLPFVN
jgi:folate-binding protein YgfZ